MSIPASGLVLGIDIGWSDRRPSTGVAVFEWDSSIVSFQRAVVRAAELQGTLEELVGGKEILCAALDGPLGANLERIDKHRVAESMLTRNQPQECRIGKPGSSASKTGYQLHKAAQRAARILHDHFRLGPSSHLAKIHDRAIVEAFPTSFLGALLAEDEVPLTKRRRRSDRFYCRLLGPDWTSPSKAGKVYWDAPLPTNRLHVLIGELLPCRQLCPFLQDVVNHDERAGVVCALTALCVVARRYMAVGDEKSGFIILPSAPDGSGVGAQDWFVKWLEGNARLGYGTLIREPAV